jgi:hydrogenase maturation protease
MKDKTLILGLGSEILKDDSLPIKLIKEIKAKNLFRKCDFETANTGGIDLLDIITGYKRVIIIDTMKTRHGIPGNVMLIDVKNLDTTMHLTKLHNVSLTTIMALGNMLDYPVPKNIFIIAVEIIEDLVFTTELSNRLLKRFSTIADRVIKLVQSIIESKHQSLNTN